MQGTARIVSSNRKVRILIEDCIFWVVHGSSVCGYISASGPFYWTDPRFKQVKKGKW